MLKKELEIIGSEFIKELTKRLIEEDKVASGNLINSLDYKVLELVDGFLLELISNDYLKYVDEGRAPGTFSPINKISKWIGDRGIVPQGITKDQLAFLISRSIYESGIRPTFVIEKTINSIYNSIDFIIEKGLNREIDKMINDFFNK
mgnify:CR=1 FL=1